MNCCQEIKWLTVVNWVTLIKQLWGHSLCRPCHVWQQLCQWRSAGGTIVGYGMNCNVYSELIQNNHACIVVPTSHFTVPFTLSVTVSHDVTIYILHYILLLHWYILATCHICIYLLLQVDAISAEYCLFLGLLLKDVSESATKRRGARAGCCWCMVPYHH